MKKWLVLFCLISCPVFAIEDELLCLRQTYLQEKRQGIQPNLLSAITLVETGRYSKKYPTGVAWPWTVHDGEKGYFYDTKAEAKNAVRELQKQGFDSIDVGCMQINLKYHPDAFDSLDDAFDPQKNVAYAGNFLKKMYEQTKSWGKAATAYHSKVQEKGRVYEDKLLEKFDKLTKFGNPAQDIRVDVKAKNKEKKEKLKQIKPPVQKKELDDLPVRRILAGSPESKEQAASWRKQKIDEYMAKRHPKENDEPIFEDFRSNQN